MAFSATFSHNSFSYLSSSSSPSTLCQTQILKTLRLPVFRTVKSAEAENEKPPQTKTEDSTNAQPSTTVSRLKKPVYSMKKGQIVRVDKEKYLNSINYLSVGHPPYYKGLGYIYEDRGEIAWVGVPTAPAWLPTDMLIKSDKLNYERI